MKSDNKKQLTEEQIKQIKKQKEKLLTQTVNKDEKDSNSRGPKR
jgi:hypothetical protein